MHYALFTSLYSFALSCFWWITIELSLRSNTFDWGEQYLDKLQCNIVIITSVLLEDSREIFAIVTLRIEFPIYGLCNKIFSAKWRLREVLVLTRICLILKDKWYWKIIRILPSIFYHGKLNRHFNFYWCLHNNLVHVSMLVYWCIQINFLQGLKAAFHNYPNIVTACWEQVSAIVYHLISTVCVETPSRQSSEHVGSPTTFIYEKVTIAAIKVATLLFYFFFSFWTSLNLISFRLIGVWISSQFEFENACVECIEVNWYVCFPFYHKGCRLCLNKFLHKHFFEKKLKKFNEVFYAVQVAYA